jgi:predicted nucleotidyltransferase
MERVLELSDIKSYVAQVAPLFDVKKITMFGSYANGEQNQKSDIDLLVEFHEDSVSLFKLSDLRYELEKLSGKKIDLIHAPIPKDSFLEINKVVPLYG